MDKWNASKWLDRSGNAVAKSLGLEEPRPDEIASQGVTDGWHWVKWRSGRCELHKSVMAFYKTYVDWVAQQAYPFRLVECSAAHVTPNNYRVTKLYASPMESNGGACWVGGQATESHESYAFISVFGRWK